MIDLFYQGGPLFMGILTIIFVLLIIVSVMIWLGKVSDFIDLDLVRQMGLFALVMGIFAQLIGLYQAFSAIQEMGSVSPAMLAGGIQVSMITTLYGILIFMISIGIHIVLKHRQSL